MSVNLHLGVIICDYQPARVKEIQRAVREVLVREEIAEDLPPLEETTDAQGICLSARSNPDRPVIITGAYEWAMRVEKSLQEVSSAANGSPVRVRFIWDDADEGRDEENDDSDWS